MVTETDALRAQFEREIGEAAPFPVERDGDSYIHRMCAWAWEGYQAGYAAAKAETAAAVAKERELCASIADRHARIGVLRSLEATYKANAAKEIADAIRAGAKEPSDD